MRSASLHVNIIGKSNGVGLARDIDLLADALWASGHRVNVTLIDDGQAKRRRSPLAQFATRARLAWGGADAKVRTAGADVNLMLEHVWLQYLSTAPVNVAVPNPEWFDRHDQRFLSQIDKRLGEDELHERAVPRARLQHHVHRLRQRGSLREQRRQAAHVFSSRRQEHDERHGSPGARLAASSASGRA